MTAVVDGETQWIVANVSVTKFVAAWILWVAKRPQAKVFQGPSDTCWRESVDLWHRDGHCTRFL